MAKKPRFEITKILETAWAPYTDQYVTKVVGVMRSTSPIVIGSQWEMQAEIEAPIEAAHGQSKVQIWIDEQLDLPLTDACEK